MPRTPILHDRRWWTAALLALGVSFTSACEDGSGKQAMGADDDADDSNAPGSDDRPATLCQLKLRTPMRRLTRTEFAFSVSDLLGVQAKVQTLPDDEQINGYAVNGVVSLQQKDVQDYGIVAHEVAKAAVTSVERFAACNLAEAACRDDVVRTTGRRFFRRPLVDDEVQAYAGVLEAKLKASSAQDAIALMLEIMLQSPNFLYRPEAGNGRAEGTFALNGYEVASRLSYFLWASGPDDDLLDAADRGELAGTTGIRTQAMRMLQDDRFHRSLKSFQLQWLGMARGFEERDGQKYPGYGESLWQASQAEAIAMAEHVYLDQNATLADMLAADFTFGDANLAKLYGAEPPEGVFGRIALPSDKRKGIITSAGFLTAMATQNSPATIRRGVFVRENVLCQHPPPPPPDTNVETPEDDGKTTVRARLEQHRSNPQCAACHAFFDPLGLALENYGAIGEWREVDNGQKIDPAGTLTETDLGDEIAFANAVEMINLLARSKTARDCLPQQWLRYAIGRGLVDSDRCALDKLLAQYEKSEFRLMDMLEAVATSDFVRFTGTKLTEEE